MIMSTQRIISLFDSARFKQTVAIDGVNYVLEIFWNTRGEFWTMNIRDVNENLLQANIRLVLFYPLTAQYNNASIPQGKFVLTDTGASTYSTDPGRHDFGVGRNLELWYITAD